MITPANCRVKMVLGVTLLCAQLAHAATPGSFTGVSKSAQYFDFDMDGATCKSPSEYSQSIPGHATVGTLIRHADGKKVVSNSHPLPNVCSHKVMKAPGMPSLFDCGVRNAF